MEVQKTKNQNFSDLKHISNYLSGIEDFRMEKKCSHKLSDILFIDYVNFMRLPYKLFDDAKVKKVFIRKNKSGEK